MKHKAWIDAQINEWRTKAKDALDGPEFVMALIYLDVLQKCRQRFLGRKLRSDNPIRQVLTRQFDRFGLPTKPLW